MALSQAEVASFAEGLDLLEPGIVFCSRRRPDHQAEQGPEVAQFGLAARKP